MRPGDKQKTDSEFIWKGTMQHLCVYGAIGRMAARNGPETALGRRLGGRNPLFVGRMLPGIRKSNPCHGQPEYPYGSIPV